MLYSFIPIRKLSLHNQPGEVLKITESDSFNIYCRQIKAYPLLSEEQIIDLAKEMRQGGKSGGRARERLITSNLYLPIRMAKRYKNSYPILDLIQEGNIGLIKAVEKFDTTSDYQFPLYAVCSIKHAVLRLLYNRYIVHVPEFKLAKGFEISEMELLEDVEENISEDSGPYNCVLQNELAGVVDSLLAGMKPKVRVVIRRRFWEEETLEAIGGRLGCTREYIRQIEEKALFKLRRSKVLAEIA